jgi:hypothetical protein
MSSSFSSHSQAPHSRFPLKNNPSTYSTDHNCLFTAIYTYSACFFFSSTCSPPSATGRARALACIGRRLADRPLRLLAPTCSHLRLFPMNLQLPLRPRSPWPFGSLAGRIPLRAGEDRSTLDHRPSASLAPLVAICGYLRSIFFISKNKCPLFSHINPASPRSP